MKELTIGECKKMLGFIIDNNHNLIDDNKTPVSVCFEGVHGIGKALVNGTNVFSEHGFVPIESLKIGDKVYNSQGYLCNVTGVFPQEEKQTVYNVCFDDGTIIPCNKNHIWTVWKSQYKMVNKTKDMTTEELYNLDKKNCLVKIRKATKKGVEYKQHLYLTVKLPKAIQYAENNNLEIDPYTLGVLIGDAYLGKSISMSLPKKKIDKFLNKLSFSPTDYCIKKDKRYDDIFHVYIYDTPTNIKSKLNSLELLGKHSFDKFIPKKYLKTSVEQRLALLQGLLDTDGHLCYDGFYEYATSSEQLAKDIVDLCRGLGLYCTIKSRIPKYIYRGIRKNGRVSYRVYINFNRKYKRIISVEKTMREAEMTCIMIDSRDHLYITEGYTLTHNTQMVEQVAREKGMTFVKINLAQIEEPSELVGFPFKEYLIEVNGKAEWVSADVLHDLNCSSIKTYDSRMNYAVPAWVPRKQNNIGTMLVLDDFTRANNLIIQAVMELINTGSYLTWRLPKYTNVVLTSNPDNGQYNLQDIDSAVLTRMVRFTTKFDIDEWTEWAEKEGIDSRLINFAYLYSNELFESKENRPQPATARSYTNFCKIVSGMSKWESTEDLQFIFSIASGCFDDDNNVVGSMFTSFINNKLDKLPEAKEIINGSWDNASSLLKSAIIRDDEYKANIANLIGTRIMNYCNNNMNNNSRKFGERLNQLAEAAHNDHPLLTQDIMYNVMKNITARNKSQTSNWFSYPAIRDLVL